MATFGTKSKSANRSIGRTLRALGLMSIAALGWSGPVLTGSATAARWR